MFMIEEIFLDPSCSVPVWIDPLAVAVIRPFTPTDQERYQYIIEKGGSPDQLYGKNFQDITVLILHDGEEYLTVEPTGELVSRVEHLQFTERTGVTRGYEEVQKPFAG